MDKSPKTFEEAVDIILNDLRSLLLKKRKDYGAKNLLTFGEKGILVRANDKLARLKHMLWDNPDKNPVCEPIDDSWKDLANYSILAMILRRGWMELSDELGTHEEERSQQSDYTLVVAHHDFKPFTVSCADGMFLITNGNEVIYHMFAISKRWEAFRGYCAAHYYETRKMLDWKDDTDCFETVGFIEGLMCSMEKTTEIMLNKKDVTSEEWEYLWELLGFYLSGAWDMATSGKLRETIKDLYNQYCEMTKSEYEDRTKPWCEQKRSWFTTATGTIDSKI